jgi:CheY-like chemotaxis protein
MKTEMSLNQISPDEIKKRARGMVVDDNNSVLQVIADFLEMLGVVEVCRFHSVIEALEVFAATPARFQFVMTDLEMPGMDGIQFRRLLHAATPETKILLMTGNGIITGAEARQMGFCGLLCKPFSTELLKNALGAAGLLLHRDGRSHGRHSNKSTPHQAVLVATG